MLQVEPPQQEARLPKDPARSLSPSACPSSRKYWPEVRWQQGVTMTRSFKAFLIQLLDFISSLILGTLVRSISF
jgi:hypothetical protein